VVPKLLMRSLLKHGSPPPLFQTRNSVNKQSHALRASTRASCLMQTASTSPSPHPPCGLRTLINSTELWKNCHRLHHTNPPATVASATKACALNTITGNAHLANAAPLLTPPRPSLSRRRRQPTRQRRSTRPLQGGRPWNNHKIIEWVVNV
jgi:hypothetical protein